MNFSIFRWSVLLLLIIDGLITYVSSNVNVLEALKTNYSTCDLPSFIKPSSTQKEEATVFINDLKTYCSNTSSTQTSPLLCRVLLIELEIACSLPINARPVTIAYTTVYTATQLCSVQRIASTNSWIWTKLTTREKEQIGKTPSQLCSKITQFNETFRLARFFYKMAPKIRRADQSNGTSSMNKTLISSVGEKVLDLARTNQSNDRLVEQVSKLSADKNTSETIQKDQNLRDGNENDQVNVDSGKANDVEVKGNATIEAEGAPKPANDKENNQGMPLGRAGEKPEREQSNERPKPKNLEVETVFKPNEREKGHWVEGKPAVIPHEKKSDNNLNQLHRMDYEEDLVAAPSQSGKRRLPYKLRLSRYRNGSDANWLIDLTTFALVFTLCVVSIYLILRGKNKILGLIIEGWRRQRSFTNRRFTGNINTTHHTRLTQPT